MRHALVLIAWIVCVSVAAPVWAQQPESPSSLQRIRASLQNPPIQPKASTPPWGEPGPPRIGILTLVAPQRRGEFVRVSLPVGDLVTRAVRVAGASKQRRAERKARDEVQRALIEFEAQSRR